MKEVPMDALDGSAASPQLTSTEPDSTDMDDGSATTSSPWRELYPPHPCADVFPMLADDELDELGKNIKEHGLREPIVLWRESDDDPWLVLDGRNRLEAMQRADVELSPDVHHSGMFRPTTNTRRGSDPNLNVDPAAFVISRNIRRRHLTKRDRVTLIARTVIAASGNDPAMLARSFNPTPGKSGGSTKDPLREQIIGQAKSFGIGTRTVERVLAEMAGNDRAARAPARTRSRSADAATPVEGTGLADRSALEPGTLPATIEEVADRIRSFCQETEDQGIPHQIVEAAGQSVFCLLSNDGRSSGSTGTASVRGDTGLTVATARCKAERGASESTSASPRARAPEEQVVDVDDSRCALSDQPSKTQQRSRSRQRTGSPTGGRR